MTVQNAIHLKLAGAFQLLFSLVLAHKLELLPQSFKSMGQGLINDLFEREASRLVREAGENSNMPKSYFAKSLEEARRLRTIPKTNFRHYNTVEKENTLHYKMDRNLEETKKLTRKLSQQATFLITPVGQVSNNLCSVIGRKMARLLYWF